MTSALPHVVVHTDGACSGNPGPGGWGAILSFGDREKELKGGEINTTNNRMELMAAISALEALKRPCRVDIHTDSQYLRNGIMSWIANWKRNGWRTSDKKPVKNVDLWKRLDAALGEHEVRWHWVRGHAGHDMNERADVLARQAIADIRAGRTISTDVLANSTLELVREWARRTHGEIESGGIFLFGSLIHRGGEQFVKSSDVDLVVVFPPGRQAASQRADWLETLRNRKQDLEVALVSHLERENAGRPICSVVAATHTEIVSDIHKDGAQHFFSENQFLDLVSDLDCRGLPDAGTEPIRDRLVVECFRFAQKKRNEYLSVAADGTGGLTPHENGDPLPKDIMRHAAMAWKLGQNDAPVGAEYDTQQGLDFMSYVLYQVRENEPYATLQNVVSIRRGARGKHSKLSANQQLLLAELIFDVAAKHLADRAARKKLPSPRVDSTVEFSNRFSQAFPGVRGIEWFNDAKVIKERLELLLRQPLVYSQSQPFWWWRDGNLPIENFKAVDNGIFLMDAAELKISRVAAANPRTYDRCFVYVEVDAMTPTGLYESTPARIAQVERGEGIWSYYWEEYAVVEGGQFVTREEHDDGAAIIDGRPVDIRGRNELRVRYVLPTTLS